MPKKIERIPRQLFGHDCFYMVNGEPYVPASSFFVGKIEVGVEYSNMQSKKAFAAPAPESQRDKLIEYAEAYKKHVSESQAEWEQAQAKKQLKEAKKREKLSGLLDTPIAFKAFHIAIMRVGIVFRLENMPGLWAHVEQGKRSGVKAICSWNRKIMKFRRLSEDEENHVLEVIAERCEHPF
jgi:hypothetical protein